MEKQETMRLDGLTRFVVFGAVGFGTGGAIAILSMLGSIPLPLSVLVVGAAGGASLGLALGDWKRTTILAILGTLGLTAGIFATLTVGSFFDYAPAPLGVLVGAVVGASLGAAFLDGRTILVLGLAGALGFGIGVAAGDLLRASFPVIRGVGSIVGRRAWLSRDPATGRRTWATRQINDRRHQDLHRIVPLPDESCSLVSYGIRVISSAV